MIYWTVFCLLLVVSVRAAPIPEEEDSEDDAEFSLPQLGVKTEEPKETFTRVDINQNKELTFDEFLHSELAYIAAKKEEFDLLDKNKDGKVSLEEYNDHFSGVGSKSDSLRAEYFGKIFEDFDEDFDMSLNIDELTRVLAERFLVKPRENFPKIFYGYDADHSGGLDLAEYMKLDATFPFDQTDAITFNPINKDKKDKLPGQKSLKKNSFDDFEAPSESDLAAVALVRAQASPILASPEPPRAAAPVILSLPAAQSPSSFPQPDLMHPVNPGPTRQSIPIVKFTKL